MFLHRAASSKIGGSQDAFTCRQSGDVASEVSWNANTTLYESSVRKSQWLTTNKGPFKLYINVPWGKEGASFTQMVLSQTETYDILA